MFLRNDGIMIFCKFGVLIVFVSITGTTHGLHRNAPAVGQAAYFLESKTATVPVFLLIVCPRTLYSVQTLARSSEDVRRT